MTDTRKPSNKAAEPTITTSAGSQRRAWLGKAAKAATSLGILALVDPLVRSSAWAAGSDAPEKAEVKIGFIPLTDCASVVMASVMGFDKKHGVKIVPTKEARSEEHTSELQSLMRISYAVFCLKKKNNNYKTDNAHAKTPKQYPIRTNIY